MCLKSNEKPFKIDFKLYLIMIIHFLKYKINIKIIRGDKEMIKTKEEYKKFFEKLNNKDETNVIDFIKEQCNKTYTENGDLSYKSTFNSFVDALFSISKYRFNPEKIKIMVRECFKIEPQLTVKLIFYIRDIRGGAGERKSFRLAIKELSKLTNITDLIKFIPEYGRYDDLLCLLDNDIDNFTKDKVYAYIASKLTSDLNLYYQNNPISLLAKWLPSENGSNIKNRKYSRKIMEKLGYTPKEYRQILSKLRKHIGIIETKITQGIFDFDYSQVPSCAMFKYRDLFMKKDKERFEEYLSEVQKGKKEIKATNLYPHEIVNKVRDLSYKSNDKEISSLDLLWNNLKDIPLPEKTICMPDFSGSMYKSGIASPINVSCGLAIYTAERNKGIWKNKFISFSDKPQLVDISNCKNIKEKVSFSLKEDDLDTNLDKTFELILNIYKNEKLNKEDIPTTLLIISDMQFNDCCEENESTYDKYKRIFEENELQIPKIIFWNVDSKVNIPTMNEQGVLLISGYSTNVLKFFNNAYTPLDLMLDILLDKRYEQIRL